LPLAFLFMIRSFWANIAQLQNWATLGPCIKTLARQPLGFVRLQV